MAFNSSKRYSDQIFTQVGSIIGVAAFGVGFLRSRKNDLVTDLVVAPTCLFIGYGAGWLVGWGFDSSIEEGWWPFLALSTGLVACKQLL